MNIQTPGSKTAASATGQGLGRRSLLIGAAALPLAAVLADPRLARAAAEGLETVSLTTPGGLVVSGALAVPAAATAPAVMLVHEWWGLNDQIKAVAAELAKLGYLALAVDLYGGKVAASAEEAKALMSSLDVPAANETITSWSDWLRGHARSSGKVASIGWCFGGGWSLNAALASPLEGCIVYYGRVNKTAEELAPLACPVLGHFATQDNFINQPMVEGFEAAMAAAGKQAEVYWYEADHAFANPTGARYDAADAALAWERTQAYLARRLG